MPGVLFGGITASLFDCMCNWAATYALGVEECNADAEANTEAEANNGKQDDKQNDANTPNANTPNGDNTAASDSPTAFHFHPILPADKVALRMCTGSLKVDYPKPVLRAALQPTGAIRTWVWVEERDRRKFVVKGEMGYARRSAGNIDKNAVNEGNKNTIPQADYAIRGTHVAVGDGKDQASRKSDDTAAFPHGIPHSQVAEEQRKLIRRIVLSSCDSSGSRGSDSDSPVSCLKLANEDDIVIVGRVESVIIDIGDVRKYHGKGKAASKL